jgi:hypothetical protein
MQLVMETSAERRQRSRQKWQVGIIMLASAIVVVGGGILLGSFIVARYKARPEPKFEMPPKVVKIPPQTPEHKMNVQKHEAMTPKPTFNDKLVSTRPVEFALPDLPEVDMDQMLPLDPSELISDQVSGLVGSAALGSGLGSGFSGGGGNGNGMSFFGIQSEGKRIVLLFDVSSSVVNKMASVGVPMEKMQEETLKLIDGLPINARFSMIQFTQNYKPFGDELVAATDGNKKAAREWVENKWVTSGSMSGSGVVSNPRGLAAVLDKAFAMKPDLIFLLSDGSFQWRPTGGIKDIPYDDLRDQLRDLEKTLPKKAALNFIGFAVDSDDEKEWKRLVRLTGGEYKDAKVEKR